MCAGQRVEEMGLATISRCYLPSMTPKDTSELVRKPLGQSGSVAQRGLHTFLALTCDAHTTTGTCGTEWYQNEQKEHWNVYTELLIMWKDAHEK